VSNSELLIKALSERNIAMEESLNEAVRINEGYTHLLKVMPIYCCNLPLL
jgi:hypothetical protein